MLPAKSRLRRRSDFDLAVRGGRRAGGKLIAVHVKKLEPGVGGELPPPRAGFIVGRAVGGAVVRNVVRRRLRHIVAARLPQFPAGSVLVVRALPPSAFAHSAQLANDLDAVLARLGVAQPVGAAS